MTQFPNISILPYEASAIADSTIATSYPSPNIVPSADNTPMTMYCCCCCCCCC